MPILLNYVKSIVYSFTIQNKFISEIWKYIYISRRSFERFCLLEVNFRIEIEHIRRSALLIKIEVHFIKVYLLQNFIQIMSIIDEQNTSRSNDI